MAGLDPLVRPLEEPWRAVLDAVLRKLHAPTTSEVARLAPRLAELSRAYNAGLAGDHPDRGRLPLEARIAFSFARDVPKGAAAVAELVSAGLLRIPEDRPLRVLDLGAGLGAMSWGVARALAARGATGAVEALLVDEDGDALAAAEAIASSAQAQHEALGLGGVRLSVRSRAGTLEAGAYPEADLVLLGQVLSELDTTLDDESRTARHADLVASLLERTCRKDGSLVVVEPALRDRTRHLHAVRDRVLAAGGATVLAPCLHARPCPALAAEGDWCHEDRAVDLPAWLVPLARAAGLRFQGLTFSYLVLRRDGATLLPPGPREGCVRLRVVSSSMPSKGKVELFACTDEGRRVRLRRLDRDAADANDAWSALGRGDVVTLRGAGSEPPVDERGRLAPHVAVDVHATRR